MNIYHINVNDYNAIDKKLVCCIGYFDGLHLGHQELIKETNVLAKKLNVESGLITFDPDPWVVTKNVENVKHITDYNSKIKLLELFNINNLIVLNFTKEMSKLSSKHFIDLLLNNIDLKGLVYGFDFRYGYMGSGDAKTILQDASTIELIEVNSYNDEIGKISSSRIEQELLNGDIIKVNTMLGYHYHIVGKVDLEEKLNKQTVSIMYNDFIVLPKSGIYYGYTFINNNKYKIIIFIGSIDAFNHKDKNEVVVYINDYNKQVNDEEMTIYFLDLFENEQKYDTINDLIKQIHYYNNYMEEVKI